MRGRQGRGEGERVQGSMGMTTQRDGMEWPLEMAGGSYPGLDVRRKKIFDVVADWNVHHFVGGRLYVSGTHRMPTPPLLDLHAEVRVVGRNANIRDVLKVGAVNSNTGPLVFDLHGYRTSYTELLVEAREVVDGLPSDLDVPELGLTVSWRFFR